MTDPAEPMATSRYDDDILAIEQRFSHLPLPARPIAFYGSSSFRFWRSICADLGSLDIVNLGFGGGTNASGAFYFERIVMPVRPEKIVLYFGENDISNDGLSSATAFSDFLHLQRLIASRLPEVKVFVLSAKQSPAKWLYEDIVLAYNAEVAAWCKSSGRATFIDVTSALLGENHRPVGRYYEPDLIHLNPGGYAVWASLLRGVASLIA